MFGEITLSCKMSEGKDRTINLLHRLKLFVFTLERERGGGRGH